VDPTIRGTLNVLRSCNTIPSVRQVVPISSSSTVRARDDFDPFVPLDESNWRFVQLCEKIQVLSKYYQLNIVLLIPPIKYSEVFYCSKGNQVLYSLGKGNVQFWLVIFFL
jgi:hypothetical protein